MSLIVITSISPNGSPASMTSPARAPRMAGGCGLRNEIRPFERRPYESFTVAQDLRTVHAYDAKRLRAVLAPDGDGRTE